MKDSDFGKPIIAVVNSFTQFVPGHVHLKDLGQMVAREIEAAGGVAKEFNTIAVDDGIAMGHDGMLYSLAQPRSDRRQRRIYGQRPLRRCDGLHLQLRQDHAGHADGGAAHQHSRGVRLGRADGSGQGRPEGQGSCARSVDAMVAAGDESYTDEEVQTIERSRLARLAVRVRGMFTANSMNCLTEALGLSLPGNGSTACDAC
jgi:dihydroxy-acid dehydratase